MPTIDPRIISVVITELPSIITAIKDAFSAAHPDEQQPTSEDVIAAFDAAYQSSLAKDEAWLAAHPNTPNV